MPTVKAEILENAVADVFRACGVPEAEARTVAGHLVDAEACGVTSHGIIRVPQYVQAIADGHIVPDAKLRVVSETVATAVLDGQHGFGPVMALRAMDLVVDRARNAGVAAVSLFNCSHTGRLGSYTERAAGCGMAAMMMVNAGGHGQWVAPFGGKSGRLSTNPISIAVPTDGQGPLMLDIATSVAPEGKVRAAMAVGRCIPEGWIIDHEGQPTTNPADLYGPPRGALLPFGGHKGFGLAVLIDALAGGLSGAGCCASPDTPMAGMTDGVLMVVLNIAAFCDRTSFQRQMGLLVRHVKSSATSPGGFEVLAPGESELRTRMCRLRDGIPIDDGAWRQLAATIDQLGLPSL